MQRTARRRVGVTAAVLAALATTVLPSAAPASAADTPAGSPVRFEVTATTDWGDQVLVVGNVAALGAWDPGRAVALDAHGYPTWAAQALLTSDSALDGVEYKYLVREPDGTLTWEDGPNRLLRPRPGSPVTTRDAFRVSPGTPASGIAPTCVTWSTSWRYTAVFNGCGHTYGLQVLYRDGSRSACREVPATATATFPGYGPDENHPVAVSHC
ncbi:carbohydrate-binding module family 20 domain-containing protein [Streptomyces sp. NPDC090022]|uniref:carbohydrate-binding module family 20 domain-containing protein n=1 Tax=Streptomyces sp. NPDC090022 TaxID=3365920 RepID=UPI00381DB285